MSQNTLSVVKYVIDEPIVEHVPSIIRDQRIPITQTSVAWLIENTVNNPQFTDAVAEIVMNNAPLVALIITNLTNNQAFINQIGALVVNDQQVVNQIITNLTGDQQFIDELINLIVNDPNTISQLATQLDNDDSFISDLTNSILAEPNFLNTIISQLLSTPSFLNDITQSITQDTQFLNAIVVELLDDASFLTSISTAITSDSNFVNNIISQLTADTNFVENLRDVIVADPATISALTTSLMNESSFMNTISSSLIADETFKSQLASSLIADPTFITEMVDAVVADTNFLTTVISNLLNTSSFIQSVADLIEVDTVFISTVTTNILTQPTFISNIASDLLSNTQFIQDITNAVIANLPSVELLYWTETEGNGVYSQLTPKTGNEHAVIRPTNNGAFSTFPPTLVTDFGNHAINLANHIGARANLSAVIGGIQTEVSGERSATIGGNGGNVASLDSAIIGGTNSIIGLDGNESVILGGNNDTIDASTASAIIASQQCTIEDCVQSTTMSSLSSNLSTNGTRNALIATNHINVSDSDESMVMATSSLLNPTTPPTHINNGRQCAILASRQTIDDVDTLRIINGQSCLIAASENVGIIDQVVAPTQTCAAIAARSTSAGGSFIQAAVGGSIISTIDCIIGSVAPETTPVGQASIIASSLSTINDPAGENIIVIGSSSVQVNTNVSTAMIGASSGSTMTNAISSAIIADSQGNIGSNSSFSVLVGTGPADVTSCTISDTQHGSIFSSLGSSLTNIECGSIIASVEANINASNGSAVIASGPIASPATNVNVTRSTHSVVLASEGSSIILPNVPPTLGTANAIIASSGSNLTGENLSTSAAIATSSSNISTLSGTNILIGGGTGLTTGGSIGTLFASNHRQGSLKNNHASGSSLVTRGLKLTKPKPTLNDEVPGKPSTCRNVAILAGEYLDSNQMSNLLLSGTFGQAQPSAIHNSSLNRDHGPSFQIAGGTFEDPSIMYRLDRRQDGQAVQTCATTRIPGTYVEARYMETHDGQPIAFGEFVTVDASGKVRQANAGEDWMGVVVPQNLSGIYSEAYDNHWHGKYEKDIYGQIVVETVWDDALRQWLCDRKIYQPQVHDNLLKINRTDLQKSLAAIARSIDIMSNQMKDDQMKSHAEVLRGWLQTKQEEIKPKIAPKISKVYDSTLSYIPRCQRSSYVAVATRGTVVVKTEPNFGSKLTQSRSHLGTHQGLLTHVNQSQQRLQLVKIHENLDHATVIIR